MKKLLLILAIISFAITILILSLLLYLTVYQYPFDPEFPRQNFFVELYWFFYFLFGGDGKVTWWPFYPSMFGIVLLVIRANIHKFISDFNRGYVDAMSDD